MLKPLLTGVVIVVIAIASMAEHPAVATTSAHCIPVDAILAVAGRDPGFDRHVVLIGDERERAAALFNAMPPSSTEAWSLVVMFDFRDGSGMLAVGHDMSLCSRIMLSPEQWTKVRSHVFGEAV